MPTPLFAQIAFQTNVIDFANQNCCEPFFTLHNIVSLLHYAHCKRQNNYMHITFLLQLSDHYDKQLHVHN